MKKLKLIFLLFAITFTVHSYGQRFDGGITVGFNGSQIDGDKVTGYHKLGGVFGGWIQTDLSNKIFAGMELKVNQKGSRMSPSNYNDYTKFVFRLDYVELPFLVGYKVNDLLSVYYGLSYSYLFHKSYFDSFGKVDDTDIPYTKDYEIGTLGGIKVNFATILDRSWSKNLMLDLRLQNSMLSINRNNNFIVGNWNNGMYNRLISTSIFIPIQSKN